jgi:2-methylisocitrate lyase-like PEP mutase family enzyme
VLAARGARARDVAERKGLDLFINTRTDVFLRALVAENKRVEETLRRARMYQDAGADGLFVPAAIAPNALRDIGAGTDLKLNVLAWPKLPSVVQLRALGVRRMSSGSALIEYTLGRLTELAAGFLKDGHCEDSGRSYPELNALFPRS